MLLLLTLRKGYKFNLQIFLMPGQQGRRGGRIVGWLIVASTLTCGQRPDIYSGDGGGGGRFCRSLG